MIFFKKKYLIVVIFFLSCVDENQVIKEYYKDSMKPKTVFIYPNRLDTTTYTKVEYYISGDTCAKYMYFNNILKSNHYWLESGIKSIEEDIVAVKDCTFFYTESNRVDTVVVHMNIGNFKNWNSKGILIYERHILPNRKEQRIKRDSIGNVLKIDTISY